MIEIEMTKGNPQTTSFRRELKPEQYLHSPVHHAVAIGNHSTLSRIISTLPLLPDPTQIHTESDSLFQEKLADQISTVLDRRDVPLLETPLHLAVRLNDVSAAKLLASAGADVSLHNAAGWNPLQEALCRRATEIATILVHHHHLSAWAKWRRRLPRLVAVLRRMRDFYMEISFHFKSSVIPFVGKIAPSDTYKIWKRDGNLRVDTSLAGFDGLKIQRADRSFLFLGDGDITHAVPSGSLLVLNRDDRKIFDAFENARSPMSDAEVAGFCSQTSVYRPGMDVTKAELVGRKNWKKQEKTENVGDWKAKVYEVQNVLFSFKSQKVSTGKSGSEQVIPLKLDEDEDGSLGVENPSFRLAQPLPPPVKEKEYMKSLRPLVWLTEQFPLKTEELLPLLDILANEVKAVRRMRDLLTTKFPPGSFPVKVAIPVVPTVRMVIAFTKFVELQPVEKFCTPFSSCTPFSRLSTDNDDEQPNPESCCSSFTSSWLKRNNSQSGSSRSKQQQKSSSGPLDLDPFVIPEGYTWSNSGDDKSKKLKSPSL